jgi:ABC-type multidrug transport system fused ATPase/permease subunit
VHRQDLGAALLAESSAVPPGGRRLAWLAGGLWFVAKESAMRTIGYGLGLAVAVAALVTVDRIGTSDDSSQVSLLVLLVGAAVLGLVAPRWAWLAGLGPRLGHRGVRDGLRGLAAAALTMTAVVGTDIPVLARDLTKLYRRRVVVDALSLQVPAGCVFGFLGPNGAGKTTTIRMLVGLIRPQRGAVWLHGTAIRPSHPVPGRVGTLVDGPAFPGT